ncbi:heparinase II/III family protein [Halopseudomonas bauzanensis]|uniref:heparinase II/III family protein n=1 Tax=Halopseudomonas bauzanensis TaxID=653930 RepID=UPI002553C3FD|nr:heparinase II/III-family protein [Halopseudomonas bauzanensis]
MSTLLIKAGTALHLGTPNLARVALYKLGLRSGLNPVRRLSAEVPSGPFFSLPMRLADKRAEPRSGWFRQSEAFGQSLKGLDHAPPSWIAGCVSGKPVQGAERHWWQIPDFDPAVGDIKTVWEFSRFDWVLSCAQHAAKGDESALKRLNDWLADWLQSNPPYKGPNWKCGQEASIRVLHLAMAAKLLDQVGGSAPGLLDLIDVHLQRIAPTVLYAMAQDNNHGTSEAAALFIGGSWLEFNGRTEGRRFTRSGRRWLENRARRLIEKDGSFSQYSLNYHRVMLDSLSMVELWRRKLALPSFSPMFYTRAAAASDWLRYMTRSANGDGPNVGANDGARLLPLTDTDYRDYRPSIQLASVLFHSARAFSEEGDWNQPVYWLGQTLPEKQLPPPRSAQFDEGGYFVLRQTPVMALLRYPRFRFRPIQADALHLDFWVGGDNWLRDAGTFSYNTEQQWQDYFPGTAAHNTVQFDGRDQMPRLSRFLFGAWLKSNRVEPLIRSGDIQSCGAGYRDWQGAKHFRRAELSEKALRVTDQLSGFASNAVLRWRLKPGEWTIDVDAQRIQSGDFSLTVATAISIKRFELVEGWESRYYLQKTPLPVLEIEIDQPGELITTIEWMTV